jgi:hypothetical protein
MDFERKAELIELLAEQDRDVTSMVVETELPMIEHDEPAPGPVPARAAERDKPDETALSAWVDDLQEYERAHAGDSDAVELVDQLKSALLDDLAAGERERKHGDVTAADEQEGVVADFHADLAIEGAALEVRDPDDGYLLPVAVRPPAYIDSEYGGGGDDRGAPDAPSPPSPPAAPPPGAPADPPHDPRPGSSRPSAGQRDDGER